MASRPPVFRFAPSPNGLLHIGHARSALINWDLARTTGGRFLLRIEDIDTGRARAAFEQQIYEDLAWLGIGWEEPVMRQSERFPVYAAALDRLQEMDLTYPCFATRTEIRDAIAGKPWPRDPDNAPVYPGVWRDAGNGRILKARAEGRASAVRLKTDRAMAVLGLDGNAPVNWPVFDPSDPLLAGETVSGHPAAWGDVVLARKDAPTSYHLAVTVDDAAQGVSHVVRGADLEPATALHVLLQRLLGLATPFYHHHTLILDEAGEKLAKSRDSESLMALRASGVLPSEIRRRAGVLLDA